MSGSLVGGVAGAVFGSLPGGVSIMVGLGIGQLLGSLFDSQRVQRYDQGKLSDRRVSGSSYGSDIPRVWGKAKVGVNCVWFAKDADGNHLKKRKKRKRSGGKGGGGSEVTTYSYSCTLAGLVCEASIHFPATGTFSHRNPVLKRLWANDVLVYDSASPGTVVPEWHDGTETQAPSSVIVSADGTATGDTNAFRGMGYFTLEDFNLADYGNQPPQLTAEIWTDAVDLADIVSDICQSRGILASELDVSAGVGVSVSGFVCTNRAGGAEQLERLLLACDQDLAEIDGKLVLVPRSSAATFTVSEDHLGAGGAAMLAQSLPGEADLPGRVDVRYYDLGNQLQQGVMTEVRQTADVQRIETLDLPLALTGAAARAIAARRLDAAWLEGRSLRFTLPPRYLKIAPGDKGDVQAGGRSYRVRVLKTALGAAGAVEVEAVFQSSESLVQSPSGGTDPDPDDGFEPVPTLFTVWSGRDLIDDHRGRPGFYVAACAAAGWRGATIYYSSDSGTTWVEGGVVTGETIFGETVDTLSSSGATAGSFDLTNEVEVDVSASADAQLEFPATTTQDNVRSGENQALIGNEIVGFATVAPSGTDQYTLSDLLRGQRASTMTGHASGERFVLLSDDVAWVQVPDTLIGETLQVKLVGAYETLGDVTAQTVTIATPRPTELDDAKSSMLVPYMLAPTVVASYAGGSRTPVSWTTEDLSGTLEAGTVLAMVQGVVRDSSSVDDGLQAIELRANSSGDVYTLAEYQPAGAESSSFQTTFLIVPVSGDLELDYRVLVGFEDGWEIRVVGGFKPLA